MTNKTIERKTIDKITQEDLNFIYPHIEVLKETIAKLHNVHVVMEGKIIHLEKTIVKKNSEIRILIKNKEKLIAFLMMKNMLKEFNQKEKEA